MRNSIVSSAVLSGYLGVSNSDHCLDMGHFIAEGLLNGDPPPRIWEGLEKRVGTYRIVD